MLAGFSASHATPTIAVDPTAAMVTIAPRRQRVTRPGAARSPRVSGSALRGAGFGAAVWAGDSTDSVTTVPPLRLRGRSEERRGGKECVGTGRYRWSADT